MERRHIRRKKLHLLIFSAYKTGQTFNTDFANIQLKLPGKCMYIREIIREKICISYRNKIYVIFLTVLFKKKQSILRNIKKKVFIVFFSFRSAYTNSQKTLDPYRYILGIFALSIKELFTLITYTHLNCCYM